MSEAESVQVSLSRGIEVDITTTDRAGVWHGSLPQVPAVGERVWKFGGETYEVVAVEWNVGRDDEISAEVTVEKVAK